MAIKVVFFDIGDTLVTDKSWLAGAQSALGQLRDQGVRLGLISNTGDLSRDELADQYLPSDFDFDSFDEEIVLLSSEVGVEKPALSMFTMAVNHAGVSPWETLFVAETVEENWAAQRAGMRALRICKAPDDLHKIAELIGEQ